MCVHIRLSFIALPPCRLDDISAVGFLPAGSMRGEKHGERAGMEEKGETDDVEVSLPRMVILFCLFISSPNSCDHLFEGLLPQQIYWAFTSL